VNLIEKREEYTIRLSGIELGNHKYSMICDKAFFELTELNEIVDGTIHVQIEMEKSANMLSLNFKFVGEITALCDRCLDFLTIPLDFTEFLVVNLVSHVDESFENIDNIWQLHEKAHELDLQHFLYESIKLALPTQLIHPNDNNGKSTCNPEMLHKLAQLTPKEYESTETDPRWDALKQLKVTNH